LIDDDEVYQKIESSNLFMSSLNTGLDNNWYGGRLDRLIQPFTLPIKILAPRIEFPKSNFSALDVFTKKHFGSYVRKFVQSNPCMLNVFLKKKCIKRV